MGSQIIRPGQGRNVNGTEAIGMIIQQLNQFAREINVINMRMQVFQNVMIAKNVVAIPELEAEWDKLMEEAKSLAARARLVTPEGNAIVAGSQPPAEGPHGATDATDATGPVGNDDITGPCSPEELTNGPDPIGDPEGHA